jgi:hypothetical protein
MIKLKTRPMIEELKRFFFLFGPDINKADPWPKSGGPNPNIQAIFF